MRRKSFSAVRTIVKKMGLFGRTRLPVLPWLLGLNEGTDISSNRSSPVDFGEKLEVEKDSKSLGEYKKETGISRSNSRQGSLTIFFF